MRFQFAEIQECSLKGREHSVDWLPKHYWLYHQIVITGLPVWSEKKTIIKKKKIINISILEKRRWKDKEKKVQKNKKKRERIFFSMKLMKENMESLPWSSAKGRPWYNREIPPSFQRVLNASDVLVPNLQNNKY